MKITAGNQPRRIGRALFAILLISIFSLNGIFAGNVLAGSSQPQGTNPPDAQIQGPFIEGPVNAFDLKGDLRSIQQPLMQETITEDAEVERYAPGTEPKGSSSTIAGWVDPVAQTAQETGNMPSPVQNFAGMSYSANGSGFPPDTNGDVSTDYYIQTVNTSIAVYSKNGVPAMNPITFNSFFNGASSPCNNRNNGDPVVLYDRWANRWLITDFAVPGPYYECLAVSKTSNPLSGGWWLYTLKISDGSLNDYPKVGIWPDGYYLSFNMFHQPDNGWDGVQVWALERAKIMSGAPLNTVHFSIPSSAGYASLLPAHALSQPDAGSPEYFASVEPLNGLELWKFHVDWSSPASSSFTGPAVLPVANFAIAASVPQRGSTSLLDSLSYRPMMQLQFRKSGGVESLWFNHSVASSGVASIRWYELRDPGSTPYVFQQGTYQPDSLHRWMGSLAVDKDGNMAVGYNVAGQNTYPGIRYSGRLAGEIPGLLPQTESTLIDGGGSQMSTSRWGDYSSMSIDPVDDCTFWYTTEYYSNSGLNWQTRIGSFKFPSCGQPKGVINGHVRNAETIQPIPGVKVVAGSDSQNMTVITDQNGSYQMAVLGGTYDLTAGPSLPGYPSTGAANGVNLTAGQTITKDILLSPAPHIVERTTRVDDQVTYGNDNGYPEPGEAGLKLVEQLSNDGATLATHVTAHLSSQTPGVTISSADSPYPDIPAGQYIANVTPFIFSVDKSVPCGADLSFRKDVTTNQGSYTLNFNLNASVPLQRADIFNNNVEDGVDGWTAGGTNNTWGITSSLSHSASHSWTDSPSGNYLDNTNSYLKSPVLNLSGKRHIKFSVWTWYELEPGYDYVYLEYSLDGGSTWNPSPLASFNGVKKNWTEQVIDASVLDNQPNAALRFHLVSDQGVSYDGIYLDDMSLSYEPFTCSYQAALPGTPVMFSPYNQSKKTSPVTFQWIQASIGGNPEGYILRIDGAPVFTSTGVITTITRDLPVGPHTWSISAFNNSGISPNPQTWSFDVIPVKTGIAPAAPVLLWPETNSRSGSHQVTFHWSDSGAGGTPTGYIFSLDGLDIMTFNTPVTDLILMIPSGVHHWSVKAVNSYGQSSPSEEWSVNVFYMSYLPFVRQK